MRIFLGLGSNVGDREYQLRRSIDALRYGGVNVLRSASLYSTEPRDVLDQPWFLNTVVEASTDLSPGALLDLCLAIERDAGRVRNQEKGPRPIDIDILIYGSETIDLPGLTIPHPRLADRRFVLVPLAELDSDYETLLTSCPDCGSVLPGGPPLV